MSLYVNYRLAKAAMHAPCKRTEQHVLIHLSAVANDKTVKEIKDEKTKLIIALQGECYPSQDYLVSKTGYSESTVRRTLSALEKGGYLVRQRKRRESTLYKLRIPLRNQDPSKSRPFKIKTLQNDTLKEKDSSTILEKEKEKDINTSIDNKQDNSNRNILEEQPIEEEPIKENILSVVTASSSDSFSEDDARDVFELMDYPFPEAGEVALMQKAGCKLWQKLSIKELPTKTEVKLLLVKTYDEASSVIHDAESNNFQGIKNLDGWKVGTLVHKADEYNGKTLTAEEALRIVIAYYQQLYPEWKELVEKAVTAECSQRTKLEEAAANGWNGISKAIQWAKGIYKVRLDVIIRINNGEEVPQEEVVRSF